MRILHLLTNLNLNFLIVKGFVVELTHSYAKSVWRVKVRSAKLATYCNYVLKKPHFLNEKFYLQKDLACVWIEIKIINYFIIQLIFTTIHGSHCTFLYYS